MRIAFMAATFGIAVSVVAGCDRRTSGELGDTGRPRGRSDEGFIPATRYDTTATGQVTTAPVTMVAHCKKYEVEFALKPWRLKASPGTKVQFNVSAPMGDVEIYAKDTARWPFEGASPLRVSASNGSPTGATIKADATGDYSYGIRFDCKANGASDPIDVDPDIIISGGTTTDSTVSKQS